MDRTVHVSESHLLFYIIFKFVSCGNCLTGVDFFFFKFKCTIDAIIIFKTEIKFGSQLYLLFRSDL